MAWLVNRCIIGSAGWMRGHELWTIDMNWLLPKKTNMTMEIQWKVNHLKMYFLFILGLLDCNVTFCWGVYVIIYVVTIILHDGSIGHGIFYVYRSMQWLMFYRNLCRYYHTWTGWCLKVPLPPYKVRPHSSFPWIPRENEGEIGDLMSGHLSFDGD